MSQSPLDGQRITTESNLDLVVLDFFLGNEAMATGEKSDKTRSWSPAHVYQEITGYSKPPSKPEKGTHSIETKSLTRRSSWPVLWRHADLMRFA